MMRVVVLTLTLSATMAGQRAYAGASAPSAASAPAAPAAVGDGDETYRKLAIFARVLNYIENNYVDPSDPDRLVYGAIRGLVSTLDRHSQFIEPDAYAAMRRQAREASPEDGAAGAAGGIGQSASLGIRRFPGGLLYLRIPRFVAETASSLQKTLTMARAQGGFRGLVLDLRDNPGGLFDEAVRVADLFIGRGAIVSTESRGRPAETEFAHPKGTEPGYPLVVMVNGGTASSSEIVAGALRDHQRAILLGEQTFGKGSVQTVIELDDGSALKLTIARYRTPSGRSIQGVGITPDIVVEARPEASPGGKGEGVGDRGDPQLVEARRVAKQWIDSGENPDQLRERPR